MSVSSKYLTVTWDCNSDKVWYLKVTGKPFSSLRIQSKSYKINVCVYVCIYVFLDSIPSIFKKTFFVVKMQWNFGAIVRHLVVFCSCCHCFSSILGVDCITSFSSSKIVLTTILNESNFNINKNVRSKQNV